MDCSNHWWHAGTGKVAVPLSLMWMPPVKRHGNERCPLIPLCLPLDADLTLSVLQATRDENEGRLFAHVLSRFKCIPENRIGTYSGRGNGDYQGELASALRSIAMYLKRFALTPEVAFVRLNGQYGDAVAVALLIEAGVHLVTRARGYRVLEHPQIQQVLAQPPTACVTQVSTNEEVELFDGGWLSMNDGMPHVRLIVARHHAPSSDKRISVGKRLDEWVIRALHHNVARYWLPGRGCLRPLPWARGF
jgi:hypothetical protein